MPEVFVGLGCRNPHLLELLTVEADAFLDDPRGNLPLVVESVLQIFGVGNLG